ncbi:TylF/MycF/NovP-related O-methyltransferase [Neptunicella sp.]|uniref:TylF/MycF/NovP-related O-methyltransferase n=1 Tax=Neptunicella sp. TaxID=2125986 RepID=UPI003F68FA07
MSDPTKKSGEITNDSGPRTINSKRLKELSSELIHEYGDGWRRHNLNSLTVDSLARVLYFSDLYKKIIDVPGVVCEFGVQWGASLSVLTNLRSIYEPFNHSRVVYGFDTFEGFIAVDDRDGKHASLGDYASALGFEIKLEEILSLHESFAPLPQIKKHSLIKGDASKTIDTWLDDNPHAIISMAIFDMDLYQPTKDVLSKIIPRLTKGSILVFDELNCSFFPGETRAVDEVMGLNNLRLKRSELQPHCAWAVFGD